MGLAFSIGHYCRNNLGDTFDCKMDMGNKSTGMVKSAIDSKLMEGR